MANASVEQGQGSPATIRNSEDGAAVGWILGLLGAASKLREPRNRHT